MQDTWNGIYEYKGFSIWSPSDKEWIAEPNWSVKAIENYKASDECVSHTTIAKAKKWVREVGVKLNEDDYL